MKTLARDLLWWPYLDNDIEHYVKNCDPCQRTRSTPSLAPLHPWEFTKRSWSRLHVDYAGPVNGNMFFIIVDSHTKWIDAQVTSGCTYTITFNKLRESFSTHDIPYTIVLDNATCFMSSEFQEYCTSHHFCTISPFFKRTGRKCRIDSQVWTETYGYR